VSSILDALLGDEALRREHFPSTARKVFFAHAAVCPLPAAVADGIAAWARRAAEEGQFEHLHAAAEAGCRNLSATILGGSPDEIAFASSTSAALSMVSEGLDWKAGDSVVVADRDFPANLHPWLALERLGVRVVRIPRTPDGAVPVELVLEHLDASTRLVSLSSAHFGVGTPLDVDAIGRALHERGVLFCLDAIQTLGAHPVSVRHVDFLAADAHKWLLGPQGIAILWVRKERMEALRPALVGWKSVRDAKDYGSGSRAFLDDARRYEPGSLPPAGLVGLHAALELLAAVGIGSISARIRALRGRAMAGLGALDCELVGPGPEAATGILAFRPPRGLDPAVLGRSLDQAGFVLSVRDDVEGRKCLRLAPHFYNTEAEIDAFLATFARLLSAES